MERLAQLLTVLVLFVFVLALTYFTTRWIAGYAKKQNVNQNIDVIETYRIAPSKFIAIVRTGSKYLAVGVGKDELTLLTELKEDEIISGDGYQTSSAGVFRKADFRSVIEKAKARFGKNDEDGGGEEK